MDADALVADLDADQIRAVTTESQLVAVIAGAGSGKTRVLTRRVAYRLAVGSADAGHTVVLTFTREAAGELRRRLPRLGITERIAAGTFHSIAHGLLRQHWSDRDQAARTVISDRARLVREVSGGTDLDELVAEINWAAARGLSPDGYCSAARRGERRAPIAPERVADAFTAYRREKRRRGVVDLDDLLLLTIEAIETDAELREAVQWRFRHVLVDEAQDLNPLQHRLIDLLRRDRDDLFLVGDPAQAVYGFNGSDPALLVEVETRFPGIEIVRLPANHRCTPQIVEAGTHALRADGQVVDVRSARPDGPPVTVVAHDDETAEAAAVATAIARLDPTLTRHGQVAVLARTHAALGPVRTALATAGVAVRRVVDGAGSPLGMVLRDAFRAGDANRLRRWVHDQLERVELDGSEPDDPHAEVARAALDFLREQPTGDGVAFRSWVGATDPFGSEVPGVEVLTFHAAKGREWRHVHLIGCETSLVPHRSATTLAAKAEEARLLYVALTRATDELVVHWARRRGGYQRKPTPLLDGFVSTTPDAVPPPAELVTFHRPTRDRTLDRLVAWRDATARASGILPDALCSDRTLASIAERRPTSPAELDAATGIGAITARRLYAGIAAALSDDQPAEAAGEALSR